MDSYRSEVRTQDLGTTYLYLANTGKVGHRLEVKRVWSGGGEKREPILGFLLKLFWGKYPVGITFHPKEINMSWNH